MVAGEGGLVKDGLVAAGGLEKGFSISWEGVGQCGGSRLRSRVDYGCNYGDGSNDARENDGLHGDLEVMGWEQG